MKSENMKQRKLYGVPMIPFGLLAGFVGKKEDYEMTKNALEKDAETRDGKNWEVLG